MKGYGEKGYFVSTVVINEAIIRKYVEIQVKEKSGQAHLELFQVPACKCRYIYVFFWVV